MFPRRMAAALPLCLLIVACTGTPPATASPTATQITAPTASPTPTPGPTPTILPSVIEVKMTATSGASGLRPRYLPDKVTARAGDVTFQLKNVPTGAEPGTPPDHNLVVGPDAPRCTLSGCVLGSTIAQSPAVAANAEAQFTVESLAPGTYAFWCTINEHYEAGMVGTLTVTE